MINECCEHHKAVDFGGTIVKWCASANRPQVMWGQAQTYKRQASTLT